MEEKPKLKIEGEATPIRKNADRLHVKTEQRAYQIKLLPALMDDDPALLQVSEPYNFENPNGMDPISLGQTLILCMKKYGGIGLSAIQLGIPLRVFSIGYEDQNQVFFNPEILEKSEEKTKMKEGCISFPFCYTVVERPEHIKARWQDHEGKWHEGSFSGFTARVFQHEYDHLDGIVLPSKVSKLTWKMIKEKSRALYKKALKNEKLATRV